MVAVYGYNYYLKLKCEDEQEQEGVDYDGVLKRLVFTIEFLIEQGADINANDNSEKGTALHLASVLGCVYTIKLLVEKGAELEIQNIFGETPLHLAYAIGREDIVKLLIEYGADGSDLLKKLEAIQENIRKKLKISLSDIPRCAS